MSQYAISVEGIGKRYRLGERERYLTMRDLLTRTASLPFRLLTGRARRQAQRDDLWALEDVSFQIKHGESVGIVGRNGAGKSTLLKILSRVSEPTRGQGEVQGRVGSLLEVGTGFHPELTGRDNLYLSGAILGMSRADIRRRFDEIVAFAELDRFIDTPVKYYSSGMYVRLAFSVAAHMEPDILLIDEVLAVGDSEFQRKCLGRMEQLAGGGRTVLFVSHNMTIVKSLTDRSIWLNRGKVEGDGPSREIVDTYLASTQTGRLMSGVFDATALNEKRDKSEYYLHNVVLEELRLVNEAGTPAGAFYENSAIRIEMLLRCNTATKTCRCLTNIYSREGQLLFRCDPGAWTEGMEPGLYRATVVFNPGSILPGAFSAEVVITGRADTVYDRIWDAFQFDLIPDPKPTHDPHLLMYDSSPDTTVKTTDRALIRVQSSWASFEALHAQSAPLASDGLGVRK